MNSSTFFIVLFGAVTMFLCVTGTQSIKYTFINNCQYNVWPGVLTASNSPPLNSTGFELAPGASTSLDAPPNWSGRFWVRTQCTSSDKFTCIIGDCGSGQVSCNGAGGAPPVTLAEFTLNGHGGIDFYDISLVDGFNIPMSIVPQGDGCQATRCNNDINQVCPNDLAVQGAANGVIGCKSACLAYGNEKYCCSGAHNTPQTCPPSNYSKIFKDNCPQAYSYAYDDSTSTFTCPSGGDYSITFCTWD